jgi:hypothetical protein
MNNLLNISSWTYQKLIYLYHQDLRREFGDEMLLAFVDDLEESWREAGVAGVLRIWWWTIRELLTVAVPSQRSNPCVVVPLLSFLLAALVQAAELCVALHNVARVDSAVLLSAIQLTVLLPSFLNALVALVVTRVLANYSIIALQLE